MKPVVAANGHGEGGGGDDDSDNGGYSGGHAVREGVCPRLVFPRENTITVACAETPVTLLLAGSARCCVTLRTPRTRT